MICADLRARLVGGQYWPLNLNLGSIPSEDTRLGLTMLSIRVVVDAQELQQMVEDAPGLGVQVQQYPARDGTVVISGTAYGLTVLAQSIEREDVVVAIRNLLSPPRPLQLRDRVLDFSRRCYLVGIINVTPDSFYDGGKYMDVSAAIAHAEELAQEGADILEVGGESARPAPITDPREEIQRVLPVVSALKARLKLPVSVDTFKTAVAEAVLDAGADIINDISGLADPSLAEVVARHEAALVIMHLRGRPKERRDFEHYDDLIGEISAFLKQRCQVAVAAGIDHDRIILDPGPGFAKTPRHDLEVLRNFGALRVFGHPLMLAVSNKRFLGHVLGLPVDQRKEGTEAAVTLGIIYGANLIRAHDVRSVARVARVAEAMLGMGYND